MTNLKLTTSELVAAVKEHAALNYEKQGWDIVCECYDDEKIAEIIGKASTVKGAIWKVRKYVEPAAAVRADIQATAF